MSRTLLVGNHDDTIADSVRGTKIFAPDVQTALDVIDAFNPTTIIFSKDVDGGEAMINKVNSNGIAPDSCVAIVIGNKRDEEDRGKLTVYYTNEPEAEELIRQMTSRDSDILDKLHVLHALAQNATIAMDCFYHDDRSILKRGNMRAVM